MNTIKPPAPPWQMKVFPIFTLLGWALILTALIVGLFTLTPTTVDYLSNNTKATRDAAEAGSTLLTQLETLSATPRWLKPLTFLASPPSWLASP